MGQRGLFDPDPTVMRVLLQEDSNLVRFWESYLPLAEANMLFESLMHDAPLEQETVVVGGKSMLTRRRSCAFGTPGLVYRYVGATRKAHPWPPYMDTILPRVRADARCDFDFALCGLYPDGEQGLGWHGDDETDLEPGAPIGSLSVGAERDFQIRRVVDRSMGVVPKVTEIALAHGSFLTMEGPRFQRDYEHCVPKRLKVRDVRINLTFRRMRVKR
jgi:alkylated DNA repair dioxygenase AlkB